MVNYNFIIFFFHLLYCIYFIAFNLILKSYNNSFVKISFFKLTSSTILYYTLPLSFHFITISPSSYFNHHLTITTPSLPTSTAFHTAYSTPIPNPPAVSASPTRPPNYPSLPFWSAVVN